MDEKCVQENKLIVFRLDGEEYAINVKQVGAIEKVLPITRVPSTPSFIQGVINLRGVVTPVIDLKERFHHIKTALEEQTRIIIVHVNDISVGLVIDEANDVVDIKTNQIEPAPEVVGASGDDYIKGFIKLEKRLFILLDLEKVLRKEDVTQLKSVEG